MTTKTHTYEGVGQIYGRRGRWIAETIYGERKGPFREFDRAQDWMEIHWAQESKARAGVGWRDK